MSTSFGAASAADETCQSVIDKIRTEIENNLGGVPHTLTAVQYRTQVGDGVTFLVKVKISNDDYIHVKAHESEDNQVKFQGLCIDKSLDDVLDINNFE